MSEKSVHRIPKLLGGVENPADGARWGPETAACAPQARKVLGSTKWTLAKARRLAALLMLDLRRLRCWPVGTQRAITLATRLTVNHAEAVPQPCHTQGGCHWENTEGNSFKSPDWARLQTTGRTNHDKSSVTLQPPCCPPSIFVTSSKAVKVLQAEFTVCRDAQI